MMKSFIEAGAAAVHFEDQLSSEKKCGHLGGKVLVPTAQHVRTLVAARLAADVADVPTLVVARTDALSASLLTSDIDEADREFCTGERTPEGFFRVRDGIDAAIARGLAYAPYSDLIWCETSTPDMAEAEKFAAAIHDRYPGQLLAYNCSPSFNWRKHLSDAQIAAFQRELAALGYRFQFITLAGFHSLNLSMFELARGYGTEAMPAYVRLQEREFELEDEGYTATRHQREVGAGYFDQVLADDLGRHRLDARPDRLDRGGAVRDRDPDRHPSNREERRMSPLQLLATLKRPSASARPQQSPAARRADPRRDRRVHLPRALRARPRGRLVGLLHGSTGRDRHASQPLSWRAVSHDVLEARPPEVSAELAAEIARTRLRRRRRGRPARRRARPQLPDRRRRPLVRAQGRQLRPTPAGVVEMQVLAMEHALRADPSLPIARPCRTADGRPAGAVTISGVDHAVQLVTFVDGAALPPGPTSPTHPPRGGGGRRPPRPRARRLLASARPTCPPLGRDATSGASAQARFPRGRPSRPRRALARTVRDRRRAGTPLVPLSTIHGDVNPGNLLADPRRRGAHRRHRRLRRPRPRAHGDRSRHRSGLPGVRLPTTPSTRSSTC